MIARLDPRDGATADRIHRLQQASYAVERDRIGIAEFPPLLVTAAQIREEPDTFLGYWDGESLLGVVSFVVREDLLDIGRLIVDPRSFRRGIGTALVRAVEAEATTGMRLTVSTAERNAPAIRLYQQCGFRVAERTVLPDGLALIRLNKSLAGGDEAPDAVASLGFHYRALKGGDVLVRRHGRTVTVLRGASAAGFLAEIETASDAERQQAMARVTGNYRRGNERTASAHPRNRGARR